jgi:cytochrome c oxidase subunit I+III
VISTVTLNPHNLDDAAALAGRPVIDVFALPEAAKDHKSAVWWGNNLLLLIETSMFAILVACYLYFRNVDFGQWPPPQVDHPPFDLDPNPLLTGSTIELAVMLLSLVPAVLVDRACMRGPRAVRTVTVGLLVVILLEVASIGLRFHGFHELHHRYDANAYGSVTWGILFLHLLHLVISVVESGLLLVWLAVKGFDDKHARDVRITLVYWYWIVGIWVPLYLLVYWSPRWL